jgi:hypothetical protein
VQQLVSRQLNDGSRVSKTCRSYHADERWQLTRTDVSSGRTTAAVRAGRTRADEVEDQQEEAGRLGEAGGLEEKKIDV